MSPRLVVATDLDGCLLDAHDYAWEPARPALAALSTAGASLVLASSKTRVEMEVLARELTAVAGVTALVVENGAALVRCDGADIEIFGVPRRELVAALDVLTRTAGVRVRAFHTLSPDDVAALTGLAPDAAVRALQREYDEPFVLEDGDETAATALAAAAKARGLRLTRGARFFHLTGAHDKGRALRALIDREHAAGRAVTTLALGDAPNDLTLLQAAERAVIVPRPDGRLDGELAAALPRAERAPHPGPRGWNEAVLAVLRGGRLARVHETAGATR